MATRLDRLFVLLDSGSTPTIRKSAAQQLGTVQKLYPHELNNLLAKVIANLRSPSWETRVAAGHAVAAICENVPQWRPQGQPEGDASTLPVGGLLSFENFDLGKVLVHGASLLGSTGVEYDPDHSDKDVDHKQKLIHQRQLLNKRLGLDVAGNLGLAPDDLLVDEDLDARPTATTVAQTSQQTVLALVQQQQQRETDADVNIMSAREKNRAKRKAKLLSRRISKDPFVSETKNGDGDDGSEPPIKRMKPVAADALCCSGAETTPDNTINMDEADDWPFHTFYELLLQDLFHSSWDVRHGAATGLREVMKHHGTGAGRTIDTPRHLLELCNQRWLEDCALRLMCVLALDRFGDYVSDEVLAPVRETCAQTLGSVLHCMTEQNVQQTLAVLLTLFRQDQWEVRHGGLLGIKYMLAVRKDLSATLLPVVLPYIFQVLRDSDDDVRAVAAVSLVSVVEQLQPVLPHEVPVILTCLWDILLGLDDLTASTNSIMALLAALLKTYKKPGLECNSQTEAQSGDVSSLSVLVPRLFPFFRHNITSVRYSSLETLYSLLHHDTEQSIGAWLVPILCDLTRHVFQRCLLEQDAAVQTMIQKVWRRLVDVSRVEVLITIPYYSLWLCLMMQPTNIVYDKALLLEAPYKAKDHIMEPRTPRSEAAQKEAPEFIGGAEMENCDNAAMDARLRAARLLGYLCEKASRPFWLLNSGGGDDKKSVRTVQDGVSCKHVPDADHVTHTTSASAPETLVVKQEQCTDIRAVIKPDAVGAVDEHSKSDNHKTEALKPGSDGTDEKCALPVAETFSHVFSMLLCFHLNGRSALQRIVCHLVIREWAAAGKCCCEAAVLERLVQSLTETVYYDEIAQVFTRMQTECRDFIACLNQRGTSINDIFQPEVLITVEQAQALCTSVYDGVKSQIKARYQAYFSDRQQQLSATVQQTAREQQLLSLRVGTTLAGALVMLETIPNKLNPIIRPLMDSIKLEDNQQLQEFASEHLARVLSLCNSRQPCPNAKVVKNLCSFLSCDPRSQDVTASGKSSPVIWAGSCQQQQQQQQPAIITLHNMNKTATEGRKRAVGSNATRKGATSSAPVSADVPSELLDSSEALAQSIVQNRGAVTALTTAARHFGDRLPSDLPSLWDVLLGPATREFQLSPRAALKCESKPTDDQCITRTEEPALPKRKKKKTGGSRSRSIERNLSHDDARNSRPCSPVPIPSAEVSRDPEVCAETEVETWEPLSQSIHILTITGAFLHPSLHEHLLNQMPALSRCLSHPSALVRHRAARCIAMLCRVLTSPAIYYVIDTILPMLGVSDDVITRSGAVETFYHVFEALSADVVPYLALLTAPMLGRMSDQYEPVRALAAQCFATLVQLLPLEAGSVCPDDMPSRMREQRDRDRRFIDELLHPDAIQIYAVPVPVRATLRQYQQEGINWLWFLNRYQLHGILCDDMGLGKTLQSICVLAGDHHQRQAQYNATLRADCRPLPSLVVCPPTLINHWVGEVEQFVAAEHLSPVAYSGTPNERLRLRSCLDEHNLIVASYDIVRNDIDFFGSVKWNYCILDEGHIIKNAKAKSTKAIKMLECNHRLILSGTPIQNNVAELWSLFDFLMPGFLGSEQQFAARYGRPISQSREAKSSAREQEAGVLAVERLHRQVLPFILRRLKEDVLNDLPPKIVQDYHCELSKLQIDLYEDFTQTSSQELASSDQVDVTKNVHVFQAIQYLRKVCVHPALVLTPKHPQYARFMARLADDKSSLHDISHSCKLLALRQLLQDCGIGAPSSGCVESTPVVNQHRILIFCQLKAMLDIIEQHLFKAHMPQVTYLRLDGSVPTDGRMRIVNRFNNDPSIDVLLLTTHVGGLGLNLTGADTVIFVEHDWNPMADLQAMDRAHRIGQKRVVNVYRLISRGTLEEKIMGLQKFKLSVANTVVSQDNSSINSMETGQLLDLFTLYESKNNKSQSSRDDAKVLKQSLKTVLEGLNELWEERQYTDEYNLDDFVASFPK